MGAAVVDVWINVSVIDGEELTMFPDWNPLLEPLVVAVVDFYALVFWVMGESAAVRGIWAGKKCLVGAV